jgi:hypothetical protein
MEKNQSQNMFGDPTKPEVIFYDTFVDNLDFHSKILVLKRFNQYLASLEVSLNELKIQHENANANDRKEIKELINSLVELRNFAI